MPKNKLSTDEIKEKIINLVEENGYSIIVILEKEEKPTQVLEVTELISGAITPIYLTENYKKINRSSTGTVKVTSKYIRRKN